MLKKTALALTLATTMAAAPAVAQTAPQTPNLSVEAISSQGMADRTDAWTLIAAVVLVLLAVNSGGFK